MKYEVALRVLVVVEATSPQTAERLAWQEADSLRKSPKAIVSAAELVKQLSPFEASVR